MTGKTVSFLSLAATAALAATFALASGAAAQTAPASGEDILVLYYSDSGNTKAVAEYIHSRVGGDIAQIVADPPYPQDRTQKTELAKTEQSEHASHGFSASVQDLSKYRTIIIGYPIWWGDMPMPVYGFLEANDFSGKTVAPFCTSGGSGLGETVTKLQSSLSGAKVLDGLGVRAADAANSGEAALKWLGDSGIAVRDAG
ncbi:MAG: flavodoxin [Deltaproteobacteria bacterium]|jgi:flavodoxin|nr:flavodoxin [Deltaproteobacteria bacterium]